MPHCLPAEPERLTAQTPTHINGAEQQPGGRQPTNSTAENNITLPNNSLQMKTDFLSCLYVNMELCPLTSCWKHAVSLVME